MPDQLRDNLIAKGISDDQADETVERAAVLQFDAGKSRWKAGIDAQRQVIGEVVSKEHDI